MTTGGNFIHRSHFLNNSYWTKSLLEKSNFRAVFTFPKGAIDNMTKFINSEKSNITKARKTLFKEVTDSFSREDNVLVNNIISVSIPQFSLDVKRILTLGEVRYSVKNNEYQDLRLNFADDVNLSIKSFFEIYMRCFFDQETLKRSFYPDDLAFTLTVENLDEFGVPKSTETYTKCIPSFINDFNYDVQDDGSSISTTEIIIVFKKQMIGKG